MFATYSSHLSGGFTKDTNLSTNSYGLFGYGNYLVNKDEISGSDRSETISGSNFSCLRHLRAFRAVGGMGRAPLSVQGTGQVGGWRESDPRGPLEIVVSSPFFSAQNDL